MIAVINTPNSRKVLLICDVGTTLTEDMFLAPRQRFVITCVRNIALR